MWKNEKGFQAANTLYSVIISIYLYAVQNGYLCPAANTSSQCYWHFVCWQIKQPIQQKTHADALLNCYICIRVGTYGAVHVGIMASATTGDMMHKTRSIV